MKTKIVLKGKKFEIDLTQGHDLSIPVKNDGITAWWIPPAVVEPVKIDGYIGSIKQGGVTNFRNVRFNPHSHGTHTECIGHITSEPYYINEQLKENWFTAKLVSVTPVISGDDFIIPPYQLRPHLDGSFDALIIRTRPNYASKLEKDYSHTNPPFMDAACIEPILKAKISHLLIDLPSVDKEEDGGELACHRAFWQLNGDRRMHATITELIYVPDEIPDGDYLLNLQVAAFENDAAPSRPVIYKLH